MAFNFQAYRNPYVSTIADLLSRGEDAKAKALVDVANAQARAAEVRGQAYGGAIENVGKIVGGIPAQIQANKQQALKDKLTLASLTQTNFENDALAGVANDKALIDRAGSAYGAVEPDFTGPLPEGSPMPTREQTLANLPLGLRLQVREAYAKLDNSAQNLEESKAAQRAHNAQTAQLDDVRRDKQREYVSDLANELRKHDGSMGSVQLAYDHAKNAGLDAETIARIDAMYKQLEAAPTDADRLRIAGAVQLHPSTQARNLAVTKEENDRLDNEARRKQEAATLRATEAQRLNANELTRMSLWDRADARQVAADYRRDTDAAKAQLKAQENNAKIVADEQRLYAALELRKPTSYREEGAGLSLNNNMSDEDRATLAPFLDKSSGAANTTRSLTPIEFANAKNEIDKSIRARRGLPPLEKPRYEMPFEPLNVRGIGAAASIAAPGAIPASPSGAAQRGTLSPKAAQRGWFAK